MIDAILLSVTIVNSAGETPKDVARRFGRLACVSILGGDSGREDYIYILPRNSYRYIEPLESCEAQKLDLVCCGTALDTM